MRLFNLTIALLSLSYFAHGYEQADKSHLTLTDSSPVTYANYFTVEYNVSISGGWLGVDNWDTSGLVWVNCDKSSWRTSRIGTVRGNLTHVEEELQNHLCYRAPKVTASRTSVIYVVVSDGETPVGRATKRVDVTIQFIDCLGVADGTARPDICGVCNGDGSMCRIASPATRATAIWWIMATLASVFIITL